MTGLRAAEDPTGFLPVRPPDVDPRTWLEQRLRHWCGLLLPEEILTEVLLEADGYASARVAADARPDPRQRRQVVA